MKQKGFPVYICIIMSMIFWSMSYIWIKIVYECYNPITTVLLRLLIASPAMILMSKLVKKLQRIDKEDYSTFALLAFVQPFLYFLCESFSLKMVSSTVAAVIIATIPLFTPIAAFYFFKEKLSRLNIAGLGIAFIGVLLVIVKEDLSLSASPLGFLLLFCAVGTAVAYNIVLKKLSEKYNAYTVVTYQNVLGIIGFLPLFLIFELDHFMKAEPTVNVFISLGLLALLSSSLAYIFYTYAVKELGASRTSMFTNALPVFTAIFAWIFLNEGLNLRMAAGIIVVIAGLSVSQINKRKPESIPVNKTKEQPIFGSYTASPM